MTDPQRESLIELFSQAGIDHHQAFIETDGADPEWPAWYANYLQERLTRLTGLVLPLDELETLLTTMSEEHKENAPTVSWPSYYADYFIQHYLT
jgi:NAD(P)H-hydrate epimerase